MPFTPFHFGPGALLKSFLRHRFSFVTFVASQVVIDFETLYNILTHQPRLHTLFHTYLGSLIPLILTVVAVYLLARVAKFFMTLPPLRPSVTVFSAFVGVWSHVFLDSLMHGDMSPLAPFAEGNVLLGVVSLELLHLSCLACLFVGALIYGLAQTKKAP